MPFRDDSVALAARHAALDTEAAEKLRERDAAKSLLEDMRARAKLPVLDNISVAAPCRADWSKMVGDERVRACADCSQQVYNLSGMTRDEAEALIVGTRGRLCVRYFQRSDGTILLADCVVGKRRRRRRVVIAAGIAAGLAAGLGAAAAMKVTLVDQPQPPPVAPMMGQPMAPIDHDVHAIMGDPAPVTEVVTPPMGPPVSKPPASKPPAAKPPAAKPPTLIVGQMVMAPKATQKMGKLQISHPVRRDASDE